MGSLVNDLKYLLKGNQKQSFPSLTFSFEGVTGLKTIKPNIRTCRVTNINEEIEP